MGDIVCGILITNEYVDAKRKSRSPWVVCKLDMEKACDIVDWDFLAWVLKKGLGERCIKWMKGCFEFPYFFYLA